MMLSRMLQTTFKNSFRPKSNLISNRIRALNISALRSAPQRQAPIKRGSSYNIWKVTMVGWCLSIPLCIVSFHLGKYYVEIRRKNARAEALELRNEILAAGGSWDDMDSEANLKHLDEFSRRQLEAVKRDSDGQAPKHSVTASGH